MQTTRFRRRRRHRYDMINAACFRLSQAFTVFAVVSEPRREDLQVMTAMKFGARDRPERFGGARIQEGVPRSVLCRGVPTQRDGLGVVPNHMIMPLRGGACIRPPDASSL